MDGVEDCINKPYDLQDYYMGEQCVKFLYPASKLIYNLQMLLFCVCLVIIEWLHL